MATFCCVTDSNGNQCPSMALAGKEMCGEHDIAIYCCATNYRGDNCPYRARDGKDMCGVHDQFGHDMKNLQHIFPSTFKKTLR